jgi:pyruvate/2-oxoglutarate dehydrogenase complex dihydrolipoamide dehydrogenase (E3) component
MALEVDVVVLGVGTCGEDLALQLLDAGLEVAGVEAALVGGECPYWACIPSKRMIRAGNLVAEARRARRVADGIDPTPDWGTLAREIRDEVTGGWDDSFAVERFGARGGTLLKGHGRLTGPRTVSVGDRIVTARRGVVIATGSRPVTPPVPGLGDVDPWTTHDVIRAEALPESIVVLGGGAVGCELGQLMARFGAAVSIVERGERLLANEEPEASAVVEQALADDGVAVRTGVATTGVARRGDAVVLTLETGDEIEADRLLLAVGRAVDLGDLGLDSVGLDPGARALEVDERMRAADGIWAVGDVTGRAMFTHMAMRQAAVAIADILGRHEEPVRYNAVPRVTFTDPEVGAVGLTESEARAAGLDVVAAVKQVPASFRGWLHASGNAGVLKLVADRDRGVVVGATAAGPSGGEVLGMLSLAVHAGVPLDELRSMIYAFPTFHGGIGEVLGAYGRGVSTVLDPEYDGFRRLDEVGGG